jgi:hypothetical protein
LDVILTLLLLRSLAEADDDVDDSFSRCRYNNNNWVNQAKERTGLIDQQWPLVLVIIRLSMVWRCCGDVVIKRKKLVVIGDRGLYVVLFATTLRRASVLTVRCNIRGPRTRDLLVHILAMRTLRDDRHRLTVFQRAIVRNARLDPDLLRSRAF